VRGPVLSLALGGLLAATPAGAACRCYRDLATDGVFHNCGTPFTVLTVERVICTDPATGAASTYSSLKGFEPLAERDCRCGEPLPDRPREGELKPASPASPGR
jgi:hypothetical protein